ncbi:MAG: tetratricopeptide repeat protein [Acidobacteria bacterium]|nr:tetratricopeptide repeat protein [Acidobacteriota bacterium]
MAEEIPIVYTSTVGREVTTMSTSQRTMAWLLILIWIIPGLAFAEQKGRLLGKVVDPEGNPIPGVVVTATSPQIPSFKEVRTTDKKGTFIVDFRAVDVTYHYRFDKAGYQSVEAQQEWHLEGTQSYQWTMHPVSGSAVGSLPPASTSEPAILAFNGGVTALKAKDYPTAEAKFKEAVGHDPNLLQAWVALSAVQVQTGHNQQAAESAEKAMALGSQDEAVLLSRWQAYRNLKDDAKAAEALKDLEKVGRRAEEAKKIHNEAVALVKAGDNTGAFAKFQEALNIDPTLQASLLGLATAGFKIGRNAEAATAAEAVLKADPKNERAIRLRYNACLSLGDKERLIDALVGLAAVEPAVASNGLLKLAFEAYDANDKVRTKERFLKVLDVDPNQPLAHYYLAMAYVNEGATEEARSHLERFIALAPNSPEAKTAREMLKQLIKLGSE